MQNNNIAQSLLDLSGENDRRRITSFSVSNFDVFCTHSFLKEPIKCVFSSELRASREEDYFSGDEKIWYKKI